MVFYGIHRFVSHDVSISRSVKDQEISDCIHMYWRVKASHACFEAVDYLDSK